jgi:hypothetical protein
MNVIRKVRIVGLVAGVLLTGAAGLALAGTIVAWGDNSYGVVSGVPSYTDFVQVAGNSLAAAGLRSSGSIVVWGNNGYGQISNAPAGTGYLAVAGDGFTFLALRSNGSIVVWGGAIQSMFTHIPTDSGFVSVAGNSYNGIAVHADGSLAVWGDDSYGQVTDAPTGTGFVKAVTSGDPYTTYPGFLTLRSDGSLYGWDLAWGPPGGIGTGFVDIAASSWGGLALRSDGSITAWGTDNWGQVSNAPKGTGFKAISMNYSNGMALHSDGSIAVWGYNGQYTVKVKGKNVVKYGPSLISLAPTGSGFTSLGETGDDDPGAGVGLAIHGP